MRSVVRQLGRSDSGRRELSPRQTAGQVVIWKGLARLGSDLHDAQLISLDWTT